MRPYLDVRTGTESTVAPRLVPENPSAIPVRSGSRQRGGRKRQRRQAESPSRRLCLRSQMFLGNGYRSLTCLSDWRYR